MDPITLLTMLDEQDESFRSIYPKYKPIFEAEQAAQAQIDQLNAISSASRTTVPSSSTSSSLPSTTTSSSSSSSSIDKSNKTGGVKATKLIHIISSGTSFKATTLELSRDTDLFRTPLFTSEQSWSSTKAVEGGKIAENLMIKLPNYMIDPYVSPDGRNTLVVAGEYFKIPGYNRVYGAINIGDVINASSSSSSSSTITNNDSSILKRDVLAQVSFRIDPNPNKSSSSLGNNDDDLNMRYRYQQTYKVAGRWESTLASIKLFNPVNWPFTENKIFYIRIIMDPRGVFSYVDGKAFSYTPYPPGWKPSDPHSLVVQIPIAGDAGEKSTWKINGLWWGRCRTDEGADNIYKEYTKTNATSTVQTVIENEIYITGLPVGAGDAAIRDALMEAFRIYGATEIKKETVGSAVVVVRDPSKVSEAINATDRRINILGSVVNVKKAIRSLDKSFVSNSSSIGTGGSTVGSAGLRGSIGPPLTNRSTPGYSPYTGNM